MKAKSLISNIIMSLILVYVSVSYKSHSRSDVTTVWYSGMSEMKPKSLIPSEKMKLINKNTNPVKTPQRRGDEMKFIYAMAKTESGNDQYVINNSGHMGKYQFSPSTLRSLGFNVTPIEFLENETLQDSAMVMNMRKNSYILRKVIRDFSNQWVAGVYVTKSGILAAAHLVGPGGVLAFFYPGTYSASIEDGNGTHLLQYMNRFSNYSLSI